MEYQKFIPWVISTVYWDKHVIKYIYSIYWYVILCMVQWLPYEWGDLYLFLFTIHQKIFTPVLFVPLLSLLLGGKLKLGKFQCLEVKIILCTVFCLMPQRDNRFVVSVYCYKWPILLFTTFKSFQLGIDKQYLTVWTLHT